MFWTFLISFLFLVKFVPHDASICCEQAALISGLCFHELPKKFSWDVRTRTVAPLTGLLAPLSGESPLLTAHPAPPPADKTTG